MVFHASRRFAAALRLATSLTFAGAGAATSVWDSPGNRSTMAQGDGKNWTFQGIQNLGALKTDGFQKEKHTVEKTWKNLNFDPTFVVELVHFYCSTKHRSGQSLKELFWWWCFCFKQIEWSITKYHKSLSKCIVWLGPWGCVKLLNNQSLAITHRFTPPKNVSILLKSVEPWNHQPLGLTGNGRLLFFFFPSLSFLRGFTAGVRFWKGWAIDQMMSTLRCFISPGPGASKHQWTALDSSPHFCGVISFDRNYLQYVFALYQLHSSSYPTCHALLLYILIVIL